MNTSKWRHLSKQGLIIAGIVSLMGGIKATSNLVNVADAVASPTQTTSHKQVVATTAEFLVCSAAPEWQRPTQEQQQKQLANDERYSELLQDKEFQQFANRFWQHDVLSFTTYGLSARMEPINLSGLWAVADDVWANCYSNDEGTAINTGTLAEAWLMHHQVVDIQWHNDHYVLLVEPSSQGMQVVQFARHEAETELPLRVVTPQGVEIDIYNADW